jgi:hypothetical protein
MYNSDGVWVISKIEFAPKFWRRSALCKYYGKAKEEAVVVVAMEILE